MSHFMQSSANSNQTFTPEYELLKNAQMKQYNKGSIQPNHMCETGQKDQCSTSSFNKLVSKGKKRNRSSYRKRDPNEMVKCGEEVFYCL